MEYFLLLLGRFWFFIGKLFSAKCLSVIVPRVGRNWVISGFLERYLKPLAYIRKQHFHEFRVTLKNTTFYFKFATRLATGKVDGINFLQFQRSTH